MAELSENYVNLFLIFIFICYSCNANLFSIFISYFSCFSSLSSARIKSSVHLKYIIDRPFRDVAQSGEELGEPGLGRRERRWGGDGLAA
jgi:hypothetical protein